jgi:hypothetical protein
MNKRLEDFLVRRLEQHRCIVCKHDEVSEIIEAHLDKLQSGETLVPLATVHSGLILPAFGVPKCMDTIRSHVRCCLKRNPATGEEL